MSARIEVFEGSHGHLQFEQKPLEFTITKSDVDRVKHIPKEQLKDLGFADASDLLDNLHLKQVDGDHYMGKINPIKPIIPMGKGGDKHPGGDNPGKPDWIPNPEDILDLSDEAKEALKAALAIAVVVGVVGICISNPALFPAAARAISILGPALAPRMMQFAR
jgi:hypothetical protein